MGIFNSLMTSINNFLFIALPYVAIAVFLIGTIYRYRNAPFTYSSLSSQFLESKSLFWGSMLFHIGIVVVFAGHLMAFLLPETLLLWNTEPVRLVILEVTGFIFGLGVLVGLLSLFVRRLMSARLRAVTSRMDIFMEILLITTVLLGCWIAVGYRWGSSWFASDLSAYLWSILVLDPEISAVSAMPLVVKLHIVLAFVLILIFPFTRLVHFLVVPLHYITRPYQVVIWNRDPREVRDTRGKWSPVRPRNN